MNLRRLQYFVKCVDLGSLNQAAEVLYVAQPALSQQLAILEGELKQSLLVRSKKGVAPTEAGKVLYQHAQNILRQCRIAHDEVQKASTDLTGAVTVGLAQFSMATSLAVQLVAKVRAQHPGIVLYVNENSSVTMSELILSGRVDLAVIGANLYGATPPHGLLFSDLMDEPLVLVGTGAATGLGSARTVAELAETDLVLPGENHFLRRLVDDSFAKHGTKPRVVAETTSAATLAELVALGVAATIVPESVARSMAAAHPQLGIQRILDPVDRARLALCHSALQPLSRAAEFVSGCIVHLASANAAGTRSASVRLAVARS